MRMKIEIFLFKCKCTSNETIGIRIVMDSFPILSIWKKEKKEEKQAKCLFQKCFFFSATVIVFDLMMHAWTKYKRKQSIIRWFLVNLQKCELLLNCGDRQMVETKFVWVLVGDNQHSLAFGNYVYGSGSLKM